MRSIQSESRKWHLKCEISFIKSNFIIHSCRDPMTICWQVGFLSRIVLIKKGYIKIANKAVLQYYAFYHRTMWGHPIRGQCWWRLTNGRLFHCQASMWGLRNWGFISHNNAIKINNISSSNKSGQFPWKVIVSNN